MMVVKGTGAQGEELTLDYRAETESEKEPRHAICLCGAGACRGSFLYHTNTANTPQQQVHQNSVDDCSARIGCHYSRPPVVTGIFELRCGCKMWLLLGHHVQVHFSTN